MPQERKGERRGRQPRMTTPGLQQTIIASETRRVPRERTWDIHQSVCHHGTTVRERRRCAHASIYLSVETN